jgi:hypothetical protein
MPPTFDTRDFGKMLARVLLCQDASSGFVEPFVTSGVFSKQTLKGKDFQEIVRLTWAQEAPGSNPGAPTKNISRVFVYLLKAPFTSNPICGILADRRFGFASRLVSESSPHDESAKT